MPAVSFLPFKKTVEVEPGTDLLEAARRAGVPIDAQCGGEGTCGRCMVRIVEGDAYGFGATLRGWVDGPVSAVVSSLPFFTRPPELRRKLIVEALLFTTSYVVQHRTVFQTPASAHGRVMVAAGTAPEASRIDAPAN